MSIYDSDEIDWDADLFGKIRGTAPETDATVAGSCPGESPEPEIDEWGWDEKSDIARNFSSEKDAIDSMRKGVKEAWSSSGSSGKAQGKEEGKPTADWMPNYGNVPNEDEPWFTG